MVDPNDPQRSPTYAAMIESMDDAVGTLLDTLDRLGIADNTIIIFASDNGGNMYNEVDGTTATSNAPLRGGKATMYEGGVRGPAVVVYPNVVRKGLTQRRGDSELRLLPDVARDAFHRTTDRANVRWDQHRAGACGESVGSRSHLHLLSAQPGHPRLVAAGGQRSSRRLETDPHLLRRRRTDSIAGSCSICATTSANNTTWPIKFPERVQELDALIEAFLVDTNAVLPTPNPKFDPSKYRPELEGKGALKGGANAAEEAKSHRPRSSNRPPAKPVAGWRPEGTCELAIENGSLVVTSSGGDPHLSYELPKAVSEQTLTLHFTMISNSSGQGQIFWQEQGVTPAFYRDRSKPFHVQHDGQSHDYAIEWSPANPVLAVRIDPSAGTGRDAVVQHQADRR